MHAYFGLHSHYNKICFFPPKWASGVADKYVGLFRKTLDAPKGCAFKGQRRFLRGRKIIETIYALTPSLGALQIVNLSSHYTVKCI